jgi:hypothetical protein
MMGHISLKVEYLQGNIREEGGSGYKGCLVETRTPLLSHCKTLTRFLENTTRLIVIK